MFHSCQSFSFAHSSLHRLATDSGECIMSVQALFFPVGKKLLLVVYWVFDFKVARRSLLELKYT